MLTEGLTPLQRLLVVVGGALLLPAVVLIALQMNAVYRLDLNHAEVQTTASADALVILADARVKADLAALRILSTSTILGASDIDAAIRRAEGAIEQTPGWVSLSLTDVAARRVIFRATAYGPQRGQGAPFIPASVPPWSGQIDGVERTGPDCPCVRLHMAVRARPGHVLTAVIDPVVFQRILLERLPDDAVAAIVDRDGEFLARSVDYSARVGTPATEYVLDAVARGGRGIYRGTTYEGFTNYTGYATSDLTGWSAHVAVNSALFDLPRARANLVLLLGAVTALLVAGGLTAYAIRDMVARRREERRMFELQKAEAVAGFTASVVHDFRNILAVVQSGLKMISRRTAEPETEKLAKVVLDALSRGTRLTNQLLSFVRQDTAEVSPVDLADLIGGVDTLLRQAAGGTCSVELIHPASGVVVNANADQIELALLNLVINARDAMDGHGRIRIAVTASGGRAEISVSDSGPGVPLAAQAHLFRPFYTTKPPGKGTGLGLAQVAGAARQAGGCVRVETSDSGGARFVVAMPLAVEETVPALARHPA